MDMFQPHANVVATGNPFDNFAGDGGVGGGGTWGENFPWDQQYGYGIR